MMDLYAVLGVERSATADDIKRAFRRLAHQLHPDKNPGDKQAEERFKEATHAYEVLSDPGARQRYDRMGAAAHAASEPRRTPAGQGVGEVFSEIFGDIFGKRGATVRERGKDRRLELEVDFRTAIFGGEQIVQVTRSQRCSGCRGTGARPGSAPQLCHACGGSGAIHVQQGVLEVNRRCNYCRGRGKIIAAPCAPCQGLGIIETPAQLRVKVPPGVEDGTTLRYAAEGEAGVGGGPPGDLRVVLNVAPHPIFERQGHDLHCELPVPLVDAALGAYVEVPTLDGRVRMRLPPGTQTGRVFRLRGKGVPLAGGEGRGDQHVTIVVEVPQNVGDRERALLEQLRACQSAGSYPRFEEFWQRVRDGD